MNIDENFDINFDFINDKIKLYLQKKKILS